MGYRNITVGGVGYKYVVGKTHLKVRGLGVVLKEDIGEKVAQHCECCGEPLDSLYDDYDVEKFGVIQVRPEHVAKFISDQVA